MDSFRPVRRKQCYGTHDQDNVLVRAPLFVERPDEALVLLVHVPFGQLQDVRPQVGHLLLAVGDLENYFYFRKNVYNVGCPEIIALENQFIVKDFI